VKYVGKECVGDFPSVLQYRCLYKLLSSTTSRTGADSCTSEMLKGLCTLVLFTEPKRSWRNDENSEWSWWNKNHPGIHFIILRYLFVGQYHIQITSKFNIVDSHVQGLWHACQGTKVGLLLAHRSNFGRTPFPLPPVTHLSIGRSWTQVCWAVPSYPMGPAGPGPPSLKGPPNSRCVNFFISWNKRN